MIAGWLKRAGTEEPSTAPRPVLELSGQALDGAHATLCAGAEGVGGMDVLLDAVAAKAALFDNQFSGDGVSYLKQQGLLDLCAFMPSVRRRIGPSLESHGIDHFRAALEDLLADFDNPDGVDARIAAFVALFPDDRKHRWVRDLAAEVLHFTAPGIYPLMTRWVWDAKANSGVLREIWHSADGAEARINVADGYVTHATLRDELTGYAIDRGVSSDPELFVDLLCAQVYGDYIRNQGSAYLKTDFSGPDGDFRYTLRMLGLDAVDASDGRTRVKLADNSNYRFSGFVEAKADQEGDGAPCLSMKNP